MESSTHLMEKETVLVEDKTGAPRLPGRRDQKNDETASSQSSEDTVNPSSDEIRPFVCGICSEKFNKVSAFYTHFKTHDFFSEMSKKNELLEKLEVKGKVDDNVFICGICRIEFPSMGLLHDHMVTEENTLNYSYSNVDHTARPDEKFQNCTQNQITGVDSNNEITGSQRRSKRNLKSTTDKKLKSSPEKRGQSKSNAINMEEDTEEDHEVNKKHSEVSQRNKRRQVVDGSLSRENTESNVLPDSQIGEINENLTPRRSSRSEHRKKIDYKALAGYETLKPKSVPVINQSDEMVKRTSSDGNEETLKPSERISKKTVPVANVKVKSLNKSRIRKVKETKQIDETENGVKKEVEGSSNKESVENETEDKMEDKSATIVEESTEKVDGTVWEPDSINAEPSLDEDDMEEDYAEHDSDDDFEDEHGLENDDNDPDYIPQQEEMENDDGENNDREVKDNNQVSSISKKINKASVSVQVYSKILKRNRNFRKPGENFQKNCLYPCSVCGRYFHKKALKKHMYAHVKVRVVQCDICNKYYKSDRHLTDHKRSVHKMVKYKCSICGSMLKGKQSIDQHTMAHVLKKETFLDFDDVPRIKATDDEYLTWKEEMAEKKLKSTITYKKKKVKKETQFSGNMGDDFDDGDEGNDDGEGNDGDEVDTNNENNEIDLDFIKEGTIHGEHFEVDQEIVGTTKNLDCTLCKEHFQTHEALVKHMLVHEDEEKHSCPVCKAFFQTPEHLESHISMIHGERDVACEICGTLHRSRYALWVHKGKHLMKKDKYYSEEVVQKLQDEIRARKKRASKGSSSQQTMTTCTICGLSVKTVRMKRHLEVHTDGRDWQCDICKKFYKTRRYLIDHKNKTHKAIMTKCDICGQFFKGKNYLEAHKQTHGPRDKECPLCGKGFTTLAYLKTHMQTHDAKKRFKCSKCLSGFSHKQRLQIHMVEVHGEGPSRPCKYCGDLFASRQKARHHERTVHEYHTKSPHKKRKFIHLLPVTSQEMTAENFDDNIGNVEMSTSRYFNNAQAIKLPLSKSKTLAEDGKLLAANADYEQTFIAKAGNEKASANVLNGGQLVQLENGQTVQLMIEKGSGQPESLEYIELSQEEQDMIIQEATASGALSQPSEGTQTHEQSVGQILEIPENAEECQILLYPDGTFKLLNVVDKSR